MDLQALELALQNRRIAAEAKGEALGRFLRGPARIMGLGIAGTIAAAQVLDIIKPDKYQVDDKVTASSTRQREKQRRDDEQVYEQEMEEAYNKGLFIDYTADAVKNKYKLGYQPGLPGDPNLNLVQSLYENRNNHTRM